MIAGVLMSYVQHSEAARHVLEVSACAFIVGELSRVRRVRGDVTRVSPGAEALFRVMFFGAVLLIPIGRAVAPDATMGGGASLFAVGVVVGWLGLLLRWWSFATLGRYFTVVLMTTEDQPVVDNGPYRVLRHPGYTGLLLAFIGSNLMIGNWVSTGASVALVLTALVHRIGVEERALDAGLGDRYRDFCAGRARLVPFVW
jgi:protein-S-isoprenylcysteine O-methyltransferase Ste14